MISNELKTESAKFDSTILELINETVKEQQAVSARISELNTLLQDKEMHSDRSENASFQLAKDERDAKTTILGLLAKRIDSLREELTEYVPNGFISRGTTVTVRAIQHDGHQPVFSPTEFTFKLVGHDTSAAKLNLVSVDSKVGEAILNHREGDKVVVSAPLGVITYLIERIY